MRLFAKAERGGDLEEVYWWVVGSCEFDADGLKYDSTLETLELPLRCAYTPPRPDSPNILRLRYVTGYRIESAPEIRFNEVFDLSFDDVRGEWTIEGVPSLTLKVNVRDLAVEVVRL